MNYFDMISTWSFQKITIVYEIVVLTIEFVLCCEFNWKKPTMCIEFRINKYIITIRKKIDFCFVYF